MFKSKIVFKLTLGFVVIVLISMLTISVLFFQMFRQYAFENREKIMLEQARNIAQAISTLSENSLQMRGYGGYMHFLNVMTDSAIWITDSEGTLAGFSGMSMGTGMGISGSGQSTLETYYNNEPLPEEAELVIQQVLSGKETISESFSSIYQEATLTIGVPITNSSQQVIGSILLHTPVTGVTETLNKAEKFLFYSLLIALLVAVGLGIYYSRIFTRPLKRINQTALEMVNGNYSVRTDLKQTDEIGQLSNSLDALASALGLSIDQLFQEKGKLNDIISSISEGLIAFDLDLKPVSQNTALAQIMNQPLPYLPDDLAKDLASLEIDNDIRTVIKEKMVLDIIKEWQDKTLKLTVSPVVDQEDHVTGCVMLVQDISESTRLEQFRRDFVANVSHEFRTPLTVFRGYLEALMDGTINNNEEIKQYYQKMLNETNSLERLVKDLLDLSRLQAGKFTLNTEQIHLPTLLHDTVTAMQTIGNRKNISIDLHEGADIPLILGDYDRLRQLFVIFIDNAIKYSSEGTSITVDLKQADPQNVSVTIQDQGFGIAKEQLPFVWDRFFKIDKSRTERGTGLGLAIAKHLIEMHHGKASIASQVNQGTTIILEFPIS